MRTPTARRVARVLAGSVLAAAVAVTLWPEPPARPLTPAATWRVVGDAEARVDLRGLHHTSHFLRDSVRFDDEAGFWRSWTPSQGNRPLSLSSPPFPAPPLLAIPVTGKTSGTSGPSALWIEHLASGQRRPVCFGSNHDSFNDILVALPPSWVGKDAILRLECSGRDNLGAGSVSAVSWLSFLKATFLGRLAVLVVAMFVYGFLLFVGAALAAACDREELCLPLGLVTLGTFALAAFYAAPLLQAGGLRSVVAVRVAVGTAGLVAAALLWSTGGEARRRAWERVREYAGLWAFATVLVAAVCGAIGTGTGHWEPNYRFWPATWSSDHELPWRFAEGIRHGDPLATMLGGGWRPTDRPPLMAAAHLLIGDLVAALQGFNDGRHLTAVFYNTVAIALNALWIPIAYWLVREVIGGLPRRTALLVVGFAATVPYSFFTTTYGWPKAFGAAFALACFGLVIEDRRAQAGASARIPCLAALAALSMLAHASTAAFLAPLAVLFAGGIRRRAWLPVVVGCLAAGLLLGSWAVYKRVMLPSHEPVTKYALTNDFGFDRPERGVIDALRDRYAQISLPEWLRLKREMLVDAVTPMRSWPAQALKVNAGDASRLGLLRAWDFHVPTFGNAAAWLAAVMALAWARRGDPPPPGDAAAVTLIVVSLSSMAFYLLVCLASPMLHHLPLAGWFGLALGGATCLALRSPRLLAFLAAAQLVYFGIVWLAHPLVHAVTFDASACVVATALVAAISGYRSFPLTPACGRGPSPDTAPEANPQECPRATEAPERPQPA